VITFNVNVDHRMKELQPYDTDEPYMYLWTT
jgi:hypothetical protein